MIKSDGTFDISGTGYENTFVERNVVISGEQIIFTYRASGFKYVDVFEVVGNANEIKLILISSEGSFQINVSTLENSELMRCCYGMQGSEIVFIHDN